MPGISLLITFHDKTKQIETAFIKSLDSVLHLERYTKRILFCEGNVFLGCTGYEDYPVSTFTAHGFHFIVEGNVYNKSKEDLETELPELAHNLFQNREKGKALLREWLFRSDGEFVVCIRHESSGNIFLFNDLLGHLPLYYAITKEHLLISREAGFIQSYSSPITLDRTAIAEYLVFAFPLGDRTLFENVRCLKPASLLHYTPGVHEIAIDSLHQLNFEEKQYRDRPLNENMEKSITLFEKACRDRANMHGSYRNILSLSGGLDSRAIAAGLKRSGIPFEGVTFLDHRGLSRYDAEIARQVAESFHIPWESVELQPADGNDTLNLLRIKQGLNYSSTRFFIPFMRKIDALYGPKFNNYNGSTGMILRDYRPAKMLKNLEDMIGFILSKGGRYCMQWLFSIHEAARLTGVSEQEILDDLAREILSYPEKSFNQKYVHFTFSGYCFRWHYEGTDMQRNFFWTHTPLESTPFFLYVMNCNDEQKKYYAFYREFLTRLAPESIDIPNASWKAPIHSKRALLKFALRSQFNRMPSIVKVALRVLFRHPPGYSPDSAMMRCFNEQIQRNSSEIGRYLDRTILADSAGKFSRIEFDTIFTITSLIELVSTGNSSLRDYADAPFE